MGLSIKDRGMVDKIIDETIKMIPEWMTAYRHEDLIKFYHYEKAEDFVFGMAYGYIQCGFSHFFRNYYGFNPTQEQLDEFVKVFNKRMSEVREAIFKTG